MAVGVLVAVTVNVDVGVSVKVLVGAFCALADIQTKKNKSIFFISDS